MRSCRHDRIANALQPPQRGRDFTQLDPVSPDLDQIVLASHEFDLAVRTVTSQISGSVQALPRSVAERVGNEPVSGERRLVQIAARKMFGTDHELARDADRYEPHLAINDVEARVRDRPTCRYPSRRTRGERRETNRGANFCRGIAVEKGRLRASPLEAGNQIGRHVRAADRNRAQSTKRIGDTRPGCKQLPEERSDKRKIRDASLLDARGQTAKIPDIVFPKNDERNAGYERKEDARD